MRFGGGLVMEVVDLAELLAQGVLGPSLGVVRACVGDGAVVPPLVVLVACLCGGGPPEKI